MGKPFEVEIDIGTLAPIRFTMDEETLRAHRSPQIQAAMMQNSPEDTDERVRLWRGAFEVLRGMLEKNAADPIRVFDGPDVWLIPDHAVRAVRLHDPESKDKKGRASIGFGRTGDE